MSGIRAIVVLSLLAFQFFLPHTDEGSPYSGRIVQEGMGARADAYLSIMSRFGYSGVTIIAKDGKILLNNGYGYADFGRGVPNGPMTAVLIGSNTKQFTAAAILKLEMLGKLKTDDTLGKFFPEAPADKRNITLHQLLTHTSGIIEYTDTEEARGDFAVQSRENAVNKALSEPLLFDPGSDFRYSNAGYSLLAAVVELVSGMSYESFVYEYLFAPADMQFTGYRRPHWSSLGVAHMHTNGVDNGNPLEKPYPYWNLLGNGGILTVAEDMYRWDQALRGDNILDGIEKEKLYTPEKQNYAYGWARRENEYGESVSHSGGSDLGAWSFYFRSLDSNAMLFFSGNIIINDLPLTYMLRRALLQILFARPFSLPENIDRTAHPDLAAWEGAYSTADGESLVVQKFEKGYFIAPLGQRVLSKLAGENEETALRHERQTAVSRRIADEILRGEAATLQESLGNDHARAKRYLEYLTNRIASVGKVERIDVLGTIDDWWSQSGQDASILEVHASGGSFVFRLQWTDETKLSGLGGQAIPKPLWLLVVPLRDGTLAAFDPVRGRSGSLELREAEGKKELLILTSGGTITALRR